MPKRLRRTRFFLRRFRRDHPIEDLINVPDNQKHRHIFDWSRDARHELLHGEAARLWGGDSHRELTFVVDHFIGGGQFRRGTIFLVRPAQLSWTVTGVPDVPSMGFAIRKSTPIAGWRIGASPTAGPRTPTQRKEISGHGKQGFRLPRLECRSSSVNRHRHQLEIGGHIKNLGPVFTPGWVGASAG